jgi:pSer/pThr/pTyr-binding forkhead associated (FHA) protein
MVVKVSLPADGETAEREIHKPPFGAPNVLVLAVIEGADTTGVHRIVQPETVLGRGETADVEIDDDEISKRHCAIRVSGSVYSIVDLGSLNGTIVNCRRLRPDVIQRLRNLDEIQVGDTRLLFLSARFTDRRSPG